MCTTINAVPSTSEATIKATLTGPESHMPAPTWMWQFPCLRVCLQRLFKKRTLAGQVLLQQEQPIHCSSGQQIKRYHGWHGGKGMKADLVWVHTEEPPCDEIFLDHVSAPHTNEAYTTVHLPACASNKGMASLRVIVTQGQVKMFYHCISSNTSILITLTKQITQLALMWATPSSLPTMVPRYPSLDHFIGLSPGILAPLVHNSQINSCWYVADTSGPAILGLPSCEKLAVIKMNCTVKVIQDTSKLPGPTPPPAALPASKKLLQSSLQRTSSRSSQIVSKA